MFFYQKLEFLTILVQFIIKMIENIAILSKMIEKVTMTYQKLI